MSNNNTTPRKHRFSFSLSPSSNKQQPSNTSPPSFLSYRQPETSPRFNLSNTVPLCDRFISNRSSSNLRYGLSSPSNAHQISSLSSPSSLFDQATNGNTTTLPQHSPPLIYEPTTHQSTVQQAQPHTDRIPHHPNGSIQFNRPRSAPIVNTSMQQQQQPEIHSGRRRRSHSLNSSSSSSTVTTTTSSSTSPNSVGSYYHSRTTPSRTLSRAGSGYSSPRGGTASSSSNNSTQLSIGSLSESGRSNNSLNNSSNSISSSSVNDSTTIFDDSSLLFNNSHEDHPNTTNLRNNSEQQPYGAIDSLAVDDFLTSTHSHTTLFDDEDEQQQEEELQLFNNLNVVCEDTIPQSRGVPNSFNLDGVLVGGKGDAFDTLLMSELLPNSHHQSLFNHNSPNHHHHSHVFYNQKSTNQYHNGSNNTTTTSTTTTTATNTNLASPPTAASATAVVKLTLNTPPNNSNILNFSPTNNKTSNGLVKSRQQTYNSNKGTPEPAFSMLIHPNNTILTKNGINLKTNKSLALVKSNNLRIIPDKPIRVLDAPGLKNDFYLNLLDWGESDLLAVVLNTNVFLWNANNHSVSSLLTTHEDNTVTSVSWMKTDPFILATGNEDGFVSIYDVQKEQKIRDVHKHNDRVGRLVWNGYCLTSGSRDNQIVISDIRTKKSVIQLGGHSQEICGLKWNNAGQQLASGGNDNNLFVWEPQHNSRYPMWKFNDGHNSAIKALSWSPYDSNLLVSGGGVSDRCMKFWDTSTGQVLRTKKTSSQICNIYWSKFTNEIITTHGLMSQNHITIWGSYPELNPVSTLYGHTERVLYLTASPDGSQIVTGSSDETIRFWSIFPSREKQSEDVISKVSLDIR